MTYNTYRKQAKTELQKLFHSIRSNRKETTMCQHLKRRLNKVKVLLRNEELADGLIAYDNKKETWFYEDNSVYQECSRLWVAENLATKRVGMGYARQVDQFYQNNAYRKAITLDDISLSDRAYFSELLGSEVAKLRTQLQASKEQHIKTIKSMNSLKQKAQKWDKLQQLLA